MMNDRTTNRKTERWTMNAICALILSLELSMAGCASDRPAAPRRC